MAETLVIGFIRSTHGLEGKVKVESTSGEIDHYFDLTEVTLRRDHSETVHKVESVSGSVASLSWVKEGIENTLLEVPSEKVINAVPF